MSSLPGRRPVADLSDALRFVQAISEMGFKAWQLLPIFDTAGRASPFAPDSFFALSPGLFSIEMALKDPLLSNAASESFREHSHSDSVVMLLEMWQRGADVTCAVPEATHQGLESWAQHRALVEETGVNEWSRWHRSLKTIGPSTDCSVQLPERLDARVRYHMFVQNVLIRQWNQLLSHAATRDVTLILDAPYSPYRSSSTTWAHRDAFQLAGDGTPALFGGVPPTREDPNGQAWKLPVYDWSHGQATQLLHDRMTWTGQLAPGVRVDHGCGYHRSWARPSNTQRADRGHWEPGPGLPSVGEALGTGKSVIVVEDSGIDEPRIQADIAGMNGLVTRILTHALTRGDSTHHQPERVPIQAALYTSTHDTDTLAGAIAGRAELNSQGASAGWIKAALDSDATLTMVALQDLLGLGSEARLNVPGRPGANWRWRAASFEPEADLASGIAEWVAQSGRQ